MRILSRAFCVLFILGLLTSTGLAQSNESQKEAVLSKLQSDFFELEEKISRLIGQQEELQYRVNLLQEAFDSLTEATDGTSNETNNEATQALQQRINQLENLGLEERLKLLEAEDIAKRIRQLEDDIKSASNGAPAVVAADPAPQEPAPAEEVADATADDENLIQATYKAAFTQLTKRQYEAAEIAFDAFIKQYPTHALTANAVYWLGESHYVRDDYRTAAQHFLTSYNDYPRGNKRFDSLLKLALSLKQLESTEQACLALSELLAASNTDGVVSDKIRIRAMSEKEKLQCP